MLPFFGNRNGSPGEDADEHPTAQLVQRLLAKAVEADASDLHLEPEESGGGRVRWRIDGFFRDVETLDARSFPRAVARLKVLTTQLPGQRVTVQSLIGNGPGRPRRELPQLLERGQSYVSLYN